MRRARGEARPGLLAGGDPGRRGGKPGDRPAIGLAIECLADADQPAWERSLAGADWIVDALLGTGASGAPQGAVATAIAAIAAVRGRGVARVLAVDLPSGLDCDTGAAAGACVRADATATFVARKRGFDAVGAAALTGPVHVIGIGAPRAVLPHCDAVSG